MIDRDKRRVLVFYRARAEARASLVTTLIGPPVSAAVSGRAGHIATTTTNGPRASSDLVAEEPRTAAGEDRYVIAKLSTLNRFLPV